MRELDLGAILTERLPYALPDVLIFRRSILNVETKGGWRARAGVPGQADYYAVTRGGRHVELETTAARGRLRPAQEAWRARCEALAIPYRVLRAAPGEAPEATVARWIEEIRAAC